MFKEIGGESAMNICTCLWKYFLPVEMSAGENIHGGRPADPLENFKYVMLLLMLQLDLSNYVLSFVVDVFLAGKSSISN